MSLWQLAQRFLGTREISGDRDNPLVVWMLQLSDPSVEDDETPWCSGFVNMICWILRRQRSGSNAARSWLTVGLEVNLSVAVPGDIVVLKRGGGTQPGPEVLKAPGHVWFFAGFAGANVLVLGGNQANSVSIAGFPVTQVLGVRRVVQETT